jgi:lipopolysaccharide transport system permease protein
VVVLDDHDEAMDVGRVSFMKMFHLNPLSGMTVLWQHRELCTALIWREVLGRYRGSTLGILWSFFNPVLMLAVYTFVFSVVFKARWNAGSESRIEFAIVLFAGLMVFNLFSECVTRAPALILSNTNYVKKVVFPLEILPWVSLGSALFHTLISLGVWLLFYAVFFGVPPATVFLLPVVVIPLIAFTMGISWFLASLGVYLRDVSQIIGILTTVLMFLSPIFYPVSSLPEEYRGLFQLNPLTPTIEMARDVLIWGKQPEWTLYGAYMAVALLVACLGFAWFQKTRKGFADVL